MLSYAHVPFGVQNLLAYRTIREDPSSLTMTPNERAVKSENPDIIGTARMGADNAGRRSEVISASVT